LWVGCDQADACAADKARARPVSMETHLFMMRRSIVVGVAQYYRQTRQPYGGFIAGHQQ
jgi:hypothetical protein